MIAIKTSIDIHASIDRVFAFMADFDNDVHWWREVRESRRTSEDGLGVGTTYWQKSRILGQTSESTFIITEYEENRRVSIQTLTGPLPYAASYIFEAGPDATRVTFSANILASGVLRLAEWVLARVLKTMTQTNFGHLKRLLEEE